MMEVRMQGGFGGLLAIAALALLAGWLSPSVAEAAKPAKGQYLCYNYDVLGFPTLAAEIWILSDEKYAGPGKKNKGKYKVGGQTDQGTKVKFKSGAYGGWWAYYTKLDGSPILDLYNDDGQVASGKCPKSD